MCKFVVGIAGCIVSLPFLSAIAQDKLQGVPAGIDLSGYQTTRFWVAAARPSLRNVWEEPIPELITAIVLDIDAQEIVYVRKENPTPLRLASSQLQAIDVLWATETAEAAHRAFLSDDFSAAVNTSKLAIADGKLPRWQQRILAAEITDSLVNMGQLTNACRVFVSLSKESPAAMLYASAPLNWTTQRGNTQLIELAQQWIIADQTPVEQLIGASWLLIGNESTAARTMMEQLSRSKTSVVSQLATAQLWRTALPNQVIEQYADWASQRDRMLLPLQIGPTMTIADKLERAGHTEEALQEWLRLVAIYPKHQREVRQARESAVDLLKRLGRIDEAEQLKKGL